MKSNIIQQILDRITPEERSQHAREMLEFMAHERWLEEQGYEYNTPNSYSLKLLNDVGHFPIGITTYMCEELFIFKTGKDAKKAWSSHVLGFDGWMYSKRQFEKEVQNDEYFKAHLYWL